MASQRTLREVSLSYQPFGGQVSVYLFGRPDDWSLAGEQANAVMVRLSHLCGELEISDIYAPRPATFNAEICTPQDLTEKIGMSHPHAGYTLYRGCDADGVVVPARSAFFIGSADCITIVAHNPRDGMTIAAHGGRDCLVDRTRINREGPQRRFESVVDAIMARFHERAAPDLLVFLTCGIGPENFSHLCDDEKYGPGNMRMVLDILAKWGSTCLVGDHFQGKVCLSEIIRAQFIRHGVLPHHIGSDTVDTFTDRDAMGRPRWWSHRRGDGKKRNGVFIVRNW